MLLLVVVVTLLGDGELYAVVPSIALDGRYLVVAVEEECLCFCFFLPLPHLLK